GRGAWCRRRRSRAADGPSSITSRTACQYRHRERGKPLESRHPGGRDMNDRCREKVPLAALAVVAALLASVGRASPPPAPPAGGPLRVIAFGAHPDDCELDEGGVAAKFAALGHKFKCVAVTNGDIGHSVLAGGPLALRRRAEA